MHRRYLRVNVFIFLIVLFNEFSPAAFCQLSNTSKPPIPVVKVTHIKSAEERNKEIDRHWKDAFKKILPELIKDPEIKKQVKYLVKLSEVDQSKKLIKKEDEDKENEAQAEARKIINKSITDIVNAKINAKIETKYPNKKGSVPNVKRNLEVWLDRASAEIPFQIYNKIISQELEDFRNSLEQIQIEDKFQIFKNFLKENQPIGLNERDCTRFCV